MATRWTSKHTGQKIDDTIDYVCNPNLLDNWYFGRPVNQRGQTEYVAQSTPGYMFDRWRTHAANGAGDTWAIADKGVLFTASASSSWRLRQMLESDDESNFGGLTLTFSIKYSGKTNDAAAVSAVIRTTSKNYTGSKSYSSDGIAIVTVTLPADAKGMYVVISCEANTSVLFEAVKLELGSQQTLAHQDANGNWVLNEIPDYGEQLRRCQRYFVNFNPYKMAWFTMPLAVASNSTLLFSNVTLPVAMRMQPVISYGGTIYASQAGNVTVTNITVSDDTFTGNSVQLKYTTAGELTSNSMYRIQGGKDTTSYIWLSADL